MRAQQCDQPADRPDKARTVLAGPVHRLREGNPQDELRQVLRQDLQGPAAGRSPPVGVIAALGRLDDLQIPGRRAEFPGEAGRRLFTGRDRRAGEDFRGCFLDNGQSFGREHQAPRRRLHRGDFAAQLVVGQQRGEQLAQARQRRPNHPVRDFLGTDLQQEGSGHQATSGARLDWSSHVLATPTASLRTRAITPTRSVTLRAPRASSRLNRWEHFST